MKNQAITKKIGFALKGLHAAWKNENNFRLHIFLGLFTVTFFLFIQPALFWWALIVLCIALVLAAELINSAIEALIDHIHVGIHPVIAKVKDMMAAAVLIVSLATVIIAVLALLDTIT